MGKVSGVYTVMITPLKPDGSVDFDGFKHDIDWQISEGIHGLLPLGSTGEFAALEDCEKDEVLDAVMKAVDGRVPVIVGTTAETTEKTIKYTCQAKDAGAAGVMILPSYYCKPNQEEMYAHFAKISDAVDIPVVMYNNPWSSGVDMLPETIVRCARYNPNLAHIKESTADIRRVRDLIWMLGDDITVFCGWEDLAWESFALGAKGWVAPLANIAPRLCVELFETMVKKGDFKKGWELYKKILPMCKQLEYSGKLQQTAKYALDKLGHAGGPSRSPRLPLTDADKVKIDALLKDLLG